MPKATLINPITGKKVVVESGSQEAQGYFGSGYRLMGAEGNPVSPAPKPAPAPIEAAIARESITPATPAATPQTPSAPAKQTIADVAKLAVPDFSEDPTVTALGARYRTESTQAVDEETIRAETRKRMQAQIDAINNATAAELASRKRITQGQVGTNIAQQARGGRLGSDFGTAETATIEDYGAQAEKAIREKSKLDIAALEGQANKDAAEEIKARRSAVDQGAENYLSYLGSQNERKRQKLTQFVQYMLSLGVDPSQLTEEQAAKIQAQYGTSRDELSALYREARAAKEAGTQKASLDAAALEKTKAETEKLQAEAGKKPEEKEIDTFVSDTGERVIVLYDPNTKTTRNVVAGKEKVKPEYGAGIIGEYNFYAEQEKAAGRAPISFNEYATMDANRKAGANKGGELLTVTEAKDLGVPYGTTREEAFGRHASGATADKALLNTQSALEAIQNLKNHPGLKPAVGLKGVRNILPGTNAQDFKAQLERTKALLTIPALQEMRGLGAMSDREFNTLTSSVAALNRNISEKDFIAELDRIEGALNATLIRLQSGALEGGTQPTETDNDYVKSLDLKPPKAGSGTGSGNRPQSNNNPGNIKKGGVADTYAQKDAQGRTLTDDQGHLVFATPDDGFRALSEDLKAKISGRSRHIANANPTLAELGRVYAEDPNWSLSVARMLGVSPNTRTRDVDFHKLVQAVARQEGYFA